MVHLYKCTFLDQEIWFKDQYFAGKYQPVLSFGSFSHLFVRLKIFDALAVLLFRDRPAAIPVEVKSIDDTSNFDEFPEVDLTWSTYTSSVLFFSEKNVEIKLYCLAGLLI